MSNPTLTDRTVQDLLTSLASTAPVPGGGSASALNGAVAAALVEMVATASAKKKSLADRADDLNDLAESARRYREELQQLFDRDATAYQAVADAFKLPKDTDEQKAERDQAIQAALQQAAQVPLRTAQCCLAVLQLAVGVADIGHPPMITDAATAGLTAAAGAEGAILNVRINLADIKDRAFYDQTVSDLGEITADMGEVAGALRDIVAGIAPVGPTPQP